MSHINDKFLEFFSPKFFTSSFIVILYMESYIHAQVLLNLLN